MNNRASFAAEDNFGSSFGGVGLKAPATTLRGENSRRTTKSKGRPRNQLVLPAKYRGSP
jgi:hypothetical protein